MNDMIAKLENPNRIAELQPAKTLARLGLKAGDRFCDIGAGTGLFSFAAAAITNAPVYALERSEEMLEVIKSKNAACDGDNIIPLKVESDKLPIGNEICDVALMCAVLHEVDDKPVMLAEVRRILKPGGTLAVIEFHKAETPIGPPFDHRISSMQVTGVLLENGFEVNTCLDLSDSFYYIIATPK